MNINIASNSGTSVVAVAGYWALEFELTKLRVQLKVGHIYRS